MGNYYEKLRKVDVSQWVEKKPRKNRKTGETVYLSYLSWANAWDQLKKLHPDANYTIYENANGWNYHTDGRTAWVKVGVTIPQTSVMLRDADDPGPAIYSQYIEHIETLPVYDFKFDAVPLDQLTSDHVNTAIQRCLAKAIALHGLGIGLYAGEDINKTDDDDLPFTFKEETETDIYTCQDCGAVITKAENDYSTKRMGRPLCRICQSGEK